MANHSAITTALGKTVPAFIIGSEDASSGKLWVLNPAATTDDSTAIESYMETSLLFFQEDWIHFFNAVQLRVTGSGTLLITISGEDGYTLPGLAIQSLTLAATPGREYLTKFSFTNEKAKMKFRLTSGYFTINKIKIFGKPMYMMRPA